jgi:hypothetical protein
MTRIGVCTLLFFVIHVHANIEHALQIWRFICCDYLSSRSELVGVSLDCKDTKLRETGSVGESVIGGRWSDHVVTKMTNENQGKWYPEVGIPDFENDMEIGWVKKVALEEYNARNVLATSERHWVWMGGREARWRGCDLPNAVPVGIHFDVSTMDRSLAVVLTRFRWMYTSTLAYVVDANPGRSCGKQFVRSTLAFVSAMVAVPLQAVGDGWLYTVFAGLVVVMQLIIVLILHKGAEVTCYVYIDI